MEKLDKKKVLAVALIIAIIASLAGVVNLLYNGIDMFLHDTGKVRFYEEVQRPYAIITLFAFITAVTATIAGILSFILKGRKGKIVCLILAFFAAGALLILTIADLGINFAYYSDDFAEEGVPLNVEGRQGYALYSAVMAIMLQQLLYEVIIAVILLIAYILDRKSEKADAPAGGEV